MSPYHHLLGADTSLFTVEAVADFGKVTAIKTFVLAASIVLIAESAFAQDSLRSSLAGDAAAETARRQQDSQLYTWKIGNLRLLAVPSLEFDYNDNINLVQSGAQSDFILKPLLQLSGSYPLTQQNQLTFSAGVGYDEYLQHQQYSAFRVDSTSALLFDMYIKDFWIDFHDRFSYIQDPATQATLAGTAQYVTMANTVGQTTIWDLEDLTLTLSYDYQDTTSPGSQFTYTDRESQLPLVRAGLRLQPELTVGVEGSADFTTYDQDVLNNNQSYSAGLYGDWQPGSYLHIQPRAGYTIYQFQHTSQSVPPPFYIGIPPHATSLQTSDLNAWYADLTVSHQASEAVTYSFSGGHEISLGIESDVVEDSYFRPNIAWAIFRDLTLNTSFFYEHGNQGEGNISGNFVETFDWYGGALTLSYSLMKKLLLTLNYRLTLRSSDVPDRGYSQNLVGIQFSYQP